MSHYLPRCCECVADGAGGYAVQHTETAPGCRHTPSGGTAGRQDGVTPCNRIIGHGRTQGAAIADARAVLGIGQ